MKYHILTPFSRGKNKEGILENFHRPNVIFHPIMEFCKYFEFPKEDWIKPFGYNRDSHINDKRVCFHAVNKFLDKNILVDEDYYIYLADDECVEPGFFQKIKHINTDFILVSMKRGDYKAKSGYGTNTLIPSSRCLSRSRIGWEQLLIKGRILKNERFRNHITADGQFIGSLWKRYPHKDFTFFPDAYVWFNYLEPGRWQ